MFRRLEDELKSFEMDDDWECSYCGIGVADDLELSKFVCAKCAEEFVFCAGKYRQLVCLQHQIYM